MQLLDVTLRYLKKKASSTMAVVGKATPAAELIMIAIHSLVQNFGTFRLPSVVKLLRFIV